MREVTGSSPVVPTKKMSAMVGALFLLCGKDAERRHLLPPSRCRLSAERRDSVSRGRDRARSGNFPTMGNFQVRKWTKPHRGFVKKALSRPSKRAPKMRRWLNNPSVLPSASHLPLHRGGYIEEVSASHRLGGARETPPRSGNAPSNGAFPSSKAVKAPPGL